MFVEEKLSSLSLHVGYLWTIVVCTILSLERGLCLGLRLSFREGSRQLLGTVSCGGFRTLFSSVVDSRAWQSQDKGLGSQAFSYVHSL